MLSQYTKDMSMSVTSVAFENKLSCARLTTNPIASINMTVFPLIHWLVCFFLSAHPHLSFHCFGFFLHLHPL